ncbi:hypothetical protein [Pseudomonas syringae group genomosp. 3]|nr:hypothetical protein [Pseudomonas syringae group genomosp. 3]
MFLLFELLWVAADEAKMQKAKRPTAGLSCNVTLMLRIARYSVN